MGVVRSGRSRSSSPCSSSIRRPVRSAASSDRARTSSYSKVGVTTSPSPNPQKTRRTASSITRSSAASVGRTSLVPAGVRRRTIRSPYRNRLSARDLAIAQQHLELSEQTGLRINPVLIAKTQAEIPLIALDVHLYWTRSREVCKQALQGPQRVLGQVLILQHDANGIIFPARSEGLHPEGHYLGVCLILPVHFTSDLDDHVFLHQLPVFSKEFGEAKNLHRPLQPIQCHKGHRLTSLGCDLLHSGHHSYDRGTGSVTQAWKLRNQVLSFLPYLMAQIMQGVGRHVQAKCLLLQSQFLFLREIPTRDLRGPRPIGVSVAAPCHPALVLFGAGIHQVKNRTLTQSCIRLHLLAMPHSLCQYVQHALARTTRGVQSATLYQTLQRSLVQDRRIYAFAKLEDILEGTACLPLLQYVGDGADSHILHSIETKANAAVHRPEIQRGLVDIGRQHLYAHLVRNRHVEGHLVLGIHDAGYQGRHVLHGIISLQIGGAIGNQRVARGMRLVERVVPRFFHEVPKVINGLGSCAVLLSSLSELGLQPLQDGSDLLANTLAEIIRFRRGKAGDTLGDLHELFLIDSHAVCRAKHRLQPRIHVLHSFGVALVPDKLRDVLHRTRTIEGHQGNQIIKRGGVHLTHGIPHATGFKLEDTLRIPLGQHLKSLAVIHGNRVNVKVPAPGFPDDTHRPRDHIQIAQAQEIHLEKSQALHIPHRHLGDHLRIPLLLKRQQFRQGPIGDDHTGCMDGVLPYQPLQGPGHVHYPAHHLLFLVSICEFPALLHAIRQGHRWTFRDHLGDPVPLTVGDIHDPRSVTDGLPSFDSPECSYLRDTIPAVFLSHILYDPVPTGH